MVTFRGNLDDEVLRNITTAAREHQKDQVGASCPRLDESKLIGFSDRVVPQRRWFCPKRDGRDATAELLPNLLYAAVPLVGANICRGLELSSWVRPDSLVMSFWSI